TRAACANKQSIFFLPLVALHAEAYAATQIVELGERAMRHFSVLLMSAAGALYSKKNDHPLVAPARAATLKMATPAKAQLMRGLVTAASAAPTAWTGFRYVGDRGN